MASERFFIQLERYFYRRVAEVPFSHSAAAGFVCVGVIMSSIILSPANSARLAAGAYPFSQTALTRLILDASNKGDYTLARELYTRLPVLGASPAESLEETVYPERFLAARLRAIEELLTDTPYWRDGLVAAGLLRRALGDDAGADVSFSQAAWLDPR